MLQRVRIFGRRLACGTVVWAAAVGLAGAVPTVTGPAAAAAQGCPDPSAPVRVNTLRSFLIHDGLASTSCDLLLVGEQVFPRQRGVLLTSADGGRTVRLAQAFNSALHVWSLTRARGRIWVAGDARDVGPVLLRARSVSGPWQRIRLPAQVTAVTAVEAQGETVWLGVQARTANGTDALLLRSRSEGTGFREVARVRSVLGQPAHLREVALSPSAVLAAGTDAIRGAALAGPAGGPLRQIRQAAELHRATGAAASGRRLFLTGATGRRDDVSRIRAALLYSTTAGKTWRLISMPGTLELSDVLVSDRRGVSAIATRRDSVMVISSKDLTSWRRQRLPGKQVAVEALFGRDGLFVVGSSGLFRLP